MAELKKKGNIRVRSNQIELIVQEMEQNPYLNGIKLSSNYTAQKRNEDWESLVNKLNSSGGAVKNVKAWQKSWSDKKSEVKKKNRILKAARLKTGGGEIIEKELTPIEERILLLIGLDAAEGLNIEESESVSTVYVIPRADECHASSAGATWFESNKENSEVTSAEFLQVEYLPTENLSQELTEPLLQELAEHHPQTPQSSKDVKPQQTPKDARFQSLRARTKPIIIKPDSTKKLIESEKEMATALTLCAEAMQKQNILKERELEIRKRRLDLQEKEFEWRLELQEKEFELKKRQTNAFEGIFNLLQNKFSE